MDSLYRKIILTIVLSLILTGCTSQKYKEYMKSGEHAKIEGNLEVAIKYFNEALKEEPNDPAAKKALEETNKLIKESEGISEYLNRGDNALTEGKYQEAIISFKKVMEYKVTDIANQKYVDRAKKSLIKAENLLAEQKDDEIITAFTNEIMQSNIKESYETAKALMQKADSLKLKTEKGRMGLEEIKKYVLSDALEYHQILQTINASNKNIQQGNIETAYNKLIKVARMKPTGTKSRQLVEEAKKIVEELEIQMAGVKADGFYE